MDSDLGFVDTAHHSSGGSLTTDQQHGSAAANSNVWSHQPDLTAANNGGGGRVGNGINVYVDDVDDAVGMPDVDIAIEDDDDDDDEMAIDDETALYADAGRSRRNNNGQHEYLSVDVDDDEIGREAALSPIGGGDFHLGSGNAAGLQLDGRLPEGDDSNLIDIEAADIDIDSLVQPYSGLMRVKHLRFIAARCPRLRREALHAALLYVKTETDMFREYEALVSDLSTTDSFSVPTNSSVAMSSKDIGTGGNQPQSGVFGVAGGVAKTAMSQADNFWIEKKRSEAQARFERLDSDLKNYKANAIKESTRRGYIDLGDYYMRIGDIDNAIRQYVKSRDYASDIKHIINACEKILKAGVINQSWGHVENYASVLESVLEGSVPQTQQQQPAAGAADEDGAAAVGGQPMRDQRYRASVDELRKLALALRFLFENNYSRAADYFLALNADFHDNPNINELVAPKDIALYGLLCALATRTRDELKQKIFPGVGGGGSSSSTSATSTTNRQAKPTAKVAGKVGEIGGSSAMQAQYGKQVSSFVPPTTQGFKNFLAEEPAARVIAESYRDGNYNECIGLLQRNKPAYLLDPILSTHISALIERIRQKGMVEYFRAYKKVFIATMAKDFVLVEQQLENELVRLICDGKMNAYIDMSDRSLRRREVDSAAENKAKLIELLKQNEQTLTHTILHVDLLRHNIAIPEEKSLPNQQHQIQQQLYQSHHHQMAPSLVGMGGTNEEMHARNAAGSSSSVADQHQQQQHQRKVPFFSNLFSGGGGGSGGGGEQQGLKPADGGGAKRGIGGRAGTFFSAVSQLQPAAAAQQPSSNNGEAGGAGMSSSHGGASSGGYNNAGDQNQNNNNNCSLTSKDSGMSLDTIGEGDDAAPTGAEGSDSAVGGANSVAGEQQQQSSSSSSGGGGGKGFFGLFSSSSSGGGSLRGAGRN